jgi:hypothetical protein
VIEYSALLSDEKGLLEDQNLEVSSASPLYADLFTMLIRVKWHLVISLFVLVGLFFGLCRQIRFRRQEEFDLPYSNDDNFNMAIPLPINVNQGSYDGACQCAPCDVDQHSELEVADWDSSRVLRGAPTERFRGMLPHQL